ncbi:hypothetical protein D3C75_551510 [compost metagenome]
MAPQAVCAVFANSRIAQERVSANSGTSVSIMEETIGIAKPLSMKSTNGLIAPVNSPSSAPAMTGMASRKAFFTLSRLGSHTVFHNRIASSVTCRNVRSNSSKAHVISRAITGANDFVKPITIEGIKSPRM